MADDEREIGRLIGRFANALDLNAWDVVRDRVASYRLFGSAGASLAGYASYLIGFAPFVVLEGTWAVVAAVALTRRILGSGRPV